MNVVLCTYVRSVNACVCVLARCGWVKIICLLWDTCCVLHNCFCLSVCLCFCRLLLSVWDPDILLLTNAVAQRQCDKLICPVLLLSSLKFLHLQNVLGTVLTQVDKLIKSNFFILCVTFQVTEHFMTYSKFKMFVYGDFMAMVWILM